MSRALSARESFLLALAVFVAGAGAFVIVRYVPYRKVVPADEGAPGDGPERTVLLAEIARLDRDRESLETTLAEVRVRSAEASARRAPSEDIPRVAAEVAGLAARSGLDVQSSEVLVGSDAESALARTGAAASGETARPVLRVSATGSYGAVESFVAGLGTLDAPVALRRVNLVRVERPGVSGATVRLEVVLVP